MRTAASSRKWVGFIAVVVVQIGVSANARAARVDVNTTNMNIVNDTKCGLAEAVTAINNRAAFSGCNRAAGTSAFGTNDAITVPAGIYQTSAIMNVYRSVVITGAGSGSTFIETGAPLGFAVSIGFVGVTPTLTLKTLTLRKLAAQSQLVTGVSVDAGAGTVAHLVLDTTVVTGFNGDGINLAGRPAQPDDATLPIGVTVAATNSTISNNMGSGILGYGMADAHLTRTTISGNHNSGLFMYQGGGAYLTESTVQGNSSAFDGGGIYVISSDACNTQATGHLSLDKSTISGNTAGHFGGGIYYEGDQGSAFTNSTISGNTAQKGGGAYLRHRCGTSYIFALYTTVAFNNATAQGGGIFTDASGGGSAALDLQKCLVARNTINNNGTASANGTDAYSPIVSGMFGTLMGTREGWICGFAPPEECAAAVPAPGQRLDPKLGALSNQGGPTRVHPLLTGSPAIDLAVVDIDNAVDQRGQLRARLVNGLVVGTNGDGLPSDHETDAGSFEKQ